MAIQNFYADRLFSSISASDNVITVTVPPTAQSGRMVLEARNATQREIIKYTGVSGNQLTGVQRGQGGTTAKPHEKNALIEMNATAEDVQDLYDAFNNFVASNGNGWINSVSTFGTPVNNGNRSYTIPTGSDLTGLITPGMRFRSTRGTPAPIQSSNFNGTNQYANKTTPSGMNQTDNISLFQWINPSVYQQGYLQSKTNTLGSDGWRLYFDSAGTITINGGTRYSSSYQSMELNKWTHIVVTISMSTNTVVMYVNGIPVANTPLSNTGSSWTSSGNYAIGAHAPGTVSTFFAGKMAQVGYTSSILSPAQVRALYSQGITAPDVSTYNIVSAYSLSGTSAFTDINTTNGNNLTAQNGLLATNNDAPFGNRGVSSILDYGIFTAVTSTNVTVQVPEGCTIPTSGSISAVAYSSVKAPYGFPNQKSRWAIQTIAATPDPISVSGNGVVTELPQFRTLVPIGDWEGSLQSNFDQESSATTQVFNIYMTNNGLSNRNFGQTLFNCRNVGVASSPGLDIYNYRSFFVSLAAATTHNLYHLPESIGSGGTIRVRGSNVGDTPSVTFVPSNL